MATAVRLLLAMAITLVNPIATREDPWRKASAAERCSRTYHFNNAYYVMEELARIDGVPADMSIHWTSGSIYFTLINEAMRMGIQVLDVSGAIDSCAGQSVCVDNTNDIVYVGTDHGVSKYVNEKLVPYAAKGEDVMYIALTNHGAIMYIATWPQNRVQKLTNEGAHSELFAAIPNGHGLTSDPKNNLYFIAAKTTYVLRSDSTTPVRIEGLSRDKVTGVSVSRTNEVYAMDENSDFFKISADAARASFLGSFNLTGVNCFALDSSDNVVVGVKNRLLRFMSHEENPCANPPNNKIGKRHNKTPQYKKRKPVAPTTPETIDDEDEDERYYA